jgi:hypothetical protein
VFVSASLQNGWVLHGPSDVRLPAGRIFGDAQDGSTRFLLLPFLVLQDIGFGEVLLKQGSMGFEERTPRHESER